MTGKSGKMDNFRDNRNRCRHCGHVTRAGNRFCTRCGTPLVTGEVEGLARLVTLDSESEKGAFVLTDRRNTLGRGISNSVLIADHQVSKQHAVIMGDHEGKFWIEDLGSRNGVFLNGGKVSGRTRLKNGDLIKLGSTILRFEPSAPGPHGNR